MNVSRLCYAWLLAALLSPLPSVADDVRVSFTAGTEGHTRQVQQCCGDPGSGGLERRASLVKRLRSQDRDMLLLDAGNIFFGGDSLASQGEVIAAAYDALGYDAINVSYRDFRLGKDVTLKLVAGCKFVAVSANLIDQATGDLLFQPFLVKQVAGEKIAVIGVTQSPAGRDILPHLKTELAGILIEPPDEALAKWLPKARADADRVILLYYGSAAGLQPLAERFGTQIDAILVGGSRQFQLPLNASPPQVATEDYGRALAVVPFPLMDGEEPSKVEHLLIDASITPDKEMAALLTKYK